MTIKPVCHLLIACLALGWASLVQGDTIVSDIIVTPTFDPSNQSPDTVDYEGTCYELGPPFCTSTPPPSSITIGVFDFSIPAGELVNGATITGTFGDQNIPGTALGDLFVDGIQVAGCDDAGALCATNQFGPLATWSYTFTPAQIAADFGSGSLDFTAIQNSPGVLVVGTPSLDLHVVPEPGSLLTLAGGMLAIAVLRRRK